MDYLPSCSKADSEQLRPVQHVLSVAYAHGLRNEVTTEKQ